MVVLLDFVTLSILHTHMDTYLFNITGIIVIQDDYENDEIMKIMEMMEMMKMIKA